MRRTLMVASAILAAGVLTSGCVTNQKVATSQVGDEQLSCTDIKAQNTKLDELAADARHNKGVNTANVAAVLLFWPAAVGNYMDSDHAEQLIDKRRGRLADLYKAKSCA
jgi:outer membrane murein-binding lipoprotein Lpp